MCCSRWFKCEVLRRSRPRHSRRARSRGDALLLRINPCLPQTDLANPKTVRDAVRPIPTHRAMRAVGTDTRLVCISFSTSWRSSPLPVPMTTSECLGIEDCLGMQDHAVRRLHRTLSSRLFKRFCQHTVRSLCLPGEGPARLRTTTRCHPLRYLTCGMEMSCRRGFHHQDDCPLGCAVRRCTKNPPLPLKLCTKSTTRPVQATAGHCMARLCNCGNAGCSHVFRLPYPLSYTSRQEIPCLTMTTPPP